MGKPETKGPKARGKDGADAKSIAVLIVEDLADDAELLVRELRRGGYAPVWERVDTEAALRAALDRRPWDLLICDYNMPRFSGIEALRALRQEDAEIPAILVSGTVGEEVAVTAMKSGASDYLMKHNLTRLVPAIARELADAEARRHRREAEAALIEEGCISAALARVGREMIAAFNTPDLLDRLSSITAEVLGCDVSHTLLYDASDDVFVPMGGFGTSPEEKEMARVIRVPRSIMATLLARLEHNDVAEVHTIPDEVIDNPTRNQFGLGAQICLALRRGSEIIGVQAAFRRASAAPFTAVEKRIGAGVAQLASLALEHARVVEQLDRASHLKSEFVATMSHELRTPLNVILGYNELLLEKAFGSLTAEQADTLQRVGASARTLLELINSTLEVTRLEQGRTPVNLVEVDLAALLGEIEDETRDLVQDRDLRIVWTVAGGLPRLRTDPAKVKVILKNLIGNAVKFTEKGQVDVRAVPRDEGVELSVADTGIGMKPETLEVIFEPFRQGDATATRRFGGVGLGLYIVRRLLDLLRGSVDVESQVGKGSTFRVWLPLDAAAGRHSGAAGR